MNNKKCPHCGFINFVTAEVCRKCETNLMASQEDYQTSYGDRPVYRGGVNSYHQPYLTKSESHLAKVLICVAALMFGAVALTAVIGVVKGRKVRWVEYHPDGLPITVMMPNEPTRSQPIVTPMAPGTMSNHTFVSVVNGQGTALFVYVDYTGFEITDELATRALDEELNDFAERTHSTVITKTPITYQGMTGLEFELSPSEQLGPKGGRSYGKMFFTSYRLYFLSLAAGNDTDLLANKDQFLNPKIQDGSVPARLKIPQVPEFKPLKPVNPL
jgi:hypothetical protein